MAGVRRIYVEKKAGCDIEAQRLKEDFIENLGVTGLKRLRVIRRYDIEGMDDDDFKRSLPTVFYEPPVDNLYLDDFPHEADERLFAAEYLPGQYDQRSDSAAQCVSLITLKAPPGVRTATVYALSGDISDGELNVIKGYVINPVDSRETGFEKASTLIEERPEPEDVPVADGFRALDKNGLAELQKDLGLAMSMDDLEFAKRYFESEGRDPTLSELRVIDTYWSDHCRHTTFSTRLTGVTFDEGKAAQKIKKEYQKYLKTRQKLDISKPVTLMDMATVYQKRAAAKGRLENVVVSDEINACTVKEPVVIDGIPHEYLIQFKNETHNHPTEIEPFGGAATCLGGAIRDPLAGRAYVYGAMRVTGSGDPRTPVSQTLPGKLPQKKITREAARGYSSYGNQIGVATGLVDELYHPGYVAKRMEIGAVIGAVSASQVKREAPAEGDVILLIGGATGRDGCGGATGSSKAHDERSTAQCGAQVQKGNPLIERKLQRLFRNPEFTLLIKKCNDFGAGGVCVAIGELAPGLDVDLDAVPKKYEGLNGTELAISESQERMAVVVDLKDVEKAVGLSNAENLDATPVARVTLTGRMRLFWRGKPIVDIARSFLDTNGAPQEARAHVADAATEGLFDEKTAGTLKESLNELLADINVCAKRGLVEMFDSTIGASTVLLPYGGKYALTPSQALAMKVPADGRVATSTIMAYGFDPYLAEQSPFHGAVYAIVSSLAKLSAAGGDIRRSYLTLQEYFPRLGDERSWGLPVAALMGAFYAQRKLRVAAIGGKDSMSGSYPGLSVPPTLVSFAVCATDARVISGEFKDPGSLIMLLRIERDELGLPDFSDMREKYSVLSAMIDEGRVISAYAVDRGGVAAAVAKMCMGNKLGANIRACFGVDFLCAKTYGDIVVEATGEINGFMRLGSVTSRHVIKYGDEEIDLNEAGRIYEKELAGVFPMSRASGLSQNRPLCKIRAKASSHLSTARPTAVITVFPGTNCEYDAQRAFLRAGARANPVVVLNRSAADIDDSIERLSQAIRSSQILMIPGGFSGGDEPDGSGKFIAAVLKNARVSDAIGDLLYNRDGLILGICNGFQALIKTGLVPYGEIREPSAGSPTLTFNTVGRHISRMVNTRVTSVKSPWLNLCETGDIHCVAISHGEGRFIAEADIVESLFENGQVATQYVDFSGAPTMDPAFNPNGSLEAIEGLLSPDGRVLGKMGHCERYSEGLYINSPGEHNQKIIESGVKYFL